MAPVLHLSADTRADRLTAVIRPAAGRRVTAVLRRNSRREPLTTSIEPIEPGTATVELRLPAGKTIAREVEVAPDGVTECAFDLRDSGQEWLDWQRVYSPKWKPPATLERTGTNWLEAVSAYRLCSVRDGRMEERPVEPELQVQQDADPLRPRAGIVRSIERDEERWSALLMSAPIFVHDGERLAITVEYTDPRTAQPMKTAVMLPLPWIGRHFEPVDVQVVVQSRSGRNGGLETDVLIQDPIIASVVSYVASGDLASARELEGVLQVVATELLQEKWQNPLGAAAGAYALLRLGVSKLGWTWNLWKMFPWLPDGAISHAAHLLREYQLGRLADIRDALLDAARAGAPVFTDGVRLLRQGLMQVQSSQRYANDPEVAEALAYANALASAAQPNQICTTVSAEPGAIPGLLCGAFQSRAASPT
jgi:hypothetical protein